MKFAELQHRMDSQSRQVFHVKLRIVIGKVWDPEAQQLVSCLTSSLGDADAAKV